MYGRGNHSNSHSPDDPGGRVNVAADMLEIDAPIAHSTPTSPAHKVQFIQLTEIGKGVWQTKQKMGQKMSLLCCTIVIIIIGLKF